MKTKSLLCASIPVLFFANEILFWIFLIAAVLITLILTIKALLKPRSNSKKEVLLILLIITTFSIYGLSVFLVGNNASHYILCLLILSILLFLDALIIEKNNLISSKKFQKILIIVTYILVFIMSLVTTGKYLSLMAGNYLKSDKARNQEVLNQNSPVQPVSCERKLI